MATRDVNQPGSSTFADFFLFRRMVTPIVVQVFFWLGVAVILLFCAIITLAAIANSHQSKGQEIVGLFCVMVLGLPLALLIWRIYCEVLILMFRMNETLSDIRDCLERRPDQRT